MKRLKRIFEFYLDASIHVAFAIVALLQVTYQTLDIPRDNHLSFFIFFGAISCYNFIKYGVEADKYILVANQYQKAIQLLSFIALGFSLYHGYFLNLRVWIGVGVLTLLTGLYALPVLPKAKSLRSWGGYKIFVVAMVWAGTTVLLPVLSANQSITWNIGVETFQRFVVILILLIPFEIRDLAFDNAALKTLPQRFGVKRTKIFGGFATIVFFLSTFLIDDLSLQALILKGILSLFLGSMIFMTKGSQSKYFASFWVEAIPIWWWGIVLVLPKLN